MPATQEQEPGTATDMPDWQRSAQVAVARDQCRKDWSSDQRLQSDQARIMVGRAFGYFAGNNCTYQEAFEAVRTASKDWSEEERPSDKDVSNAESYFIQLMDEVSGAKRSE